MATKIFSTKPKFTDKWIVCSSLYSLAELLIQKRPSQPLPFVGSDVLFAEFGMIMNMQGFSHRWNEGPQNHLYSPPADAENQTALDIRHFETLQQLQTKSRGLLHSAVLEGAIYDLRVLVNERMQMKGTLLDVAMRMRKPDGFNQHILFWPGGFHMGLSDFGKLCEELDDVW